MRVCALALALACTLLPARAETIYAALANGDIRAVETEHFTSTLLAHTGINWYDIAIAPDGTLYGSDAFRLFRIDPLGGRSTLIGEFGVFINGLDFVGDKLYGSGELWLYTIDPTTGRAQVAGSNAVYRSSGDLEWFQGELYMTCTSSWADQLVRWDLDRGRPALVGDIGFRYVYGLAGTSAGMLGLTGTGDIVKIDVESGAGMRVGSLGSAVNGGTVLPTTPQTVPESGALFLLAAGLSAGRIGLRRR